MHLRGANVEDRCAAGLLEVIERRGRADERPFVERDDARGRRGTGGGQRGGCVDERLHVTEGRMTETVTPVELDELERLLEQGAVQVLDVREKSERDDGYIPGSLHIPFRLLRGFGTESVNTEKPVVTICESGMRASIAASVLTAAGVDARPVLHGGVNDWPGGTVSFRRCGSG